MPWREHHTNTMADRAIRLRACSQLPHRTAEKEHITLHGEHRHRLYSSLMSMRIGDSVRNGSTVLLPEQTDTPFAQIFPSNPRRTASIWQAAPYCMSIQRLLPMTWRWRVCRPVIPSQSNPNTPKPTYTHHVRNNYGYHLRLSSQHVDTR